MTRKLTTLNLTMRGCGKHPRRGDIEYGFEEGCIFCVTNGLTTLAKAIDKINGVSEDPTDVNETVEVVEMIDTEWYRIVMTDNNQVWKEGYIDTIQEELTWLNNYGDYRPYRLEQLFKQTTNYWKVENINER